MLSHHGFKYCISFIDDYLRFTWIYPMKCKSECMDCLLSLKLWLKTYWTVIWKYFKVMGDITLLCCLCLQITFIFVNLVLTLNN